MKLEQLIVQYLYNNKTVTLQDIGTFTLSPNVVIPADSEKETVLPEGAIEFQYNSRAQQDDGLIEFIVQQSRKIKPLATSDLESYSLLSRQFLNIGKPMIIEGVGTLQKSQQDTYEFTQGHTINPKLENQPVTIREKEQDEISFSTPSREVTSTKPLMIVLLVFLLLATTAAVYYFLIKDENKEVPVQTEVLVPVQDTAVVQVDSSMLKLDSVVAPAPTLAGLKDSNGVAYNFSVVFKEYSSKAEADKGLARYTSYGHKVLLGQKDSSTYRLSIPFTKPLSDTARARDSLRLLFGGKPYVEL